jgi:hypothetical protein
MARKGAPITPGYLCKTGGQWRAVRLLDLAVLLYAVHQASTDEQVGFEDARETIQTLTRRLNKSVLIDPNHIESALWSANLLDEQAKFRHPTGMSFEEFAQRIVGKDTFNRRYNVIERKDND